MKPKVQRDFRNYTNDPNFPPLIIYGRQHAEMTFASAQKMIARYEAACSNGHIIEYGQEIGDIDQERLASQGAVIPMSMWQIFNLLRYSFDATDPDNFTDAQDLHSLQVGLAGGNSQTYEAKMLRLFGFIHDISKAIFGIDMADQLVVGGDIYPLGLCPREVKGREGKDMIPYWDHGFANNADWKNDLYPKDPQDPDYKYGVYAPLVHEGKMGLGNLVMLFQHDKHLHIILDHMDAADHNVPDEWMKVFKFLAAYHSFHALHDFDTMEEVESGPFWWAANEEERAMLKGRIPEKHKFRDLYTKLQVPDKGAYRDEHYPTVKKMLDQYFPKPIMVPVLTDRLPRFLRLMETQDLNEVLTLLSPAVMFRPQGGIALKPFETDKPFKGELINGTLELLRVRAEAEKSPELLRMVQEMAFGLPPTSKFYGIARPLEEVLAGFDPQSPRPPALRVAIEKERPGIIKKATLGWPSFV